MKWLITFFIMASLSVKLNAFDELTDATLKEIKLAADEIQNIDKSSNYYYKLEREETLRKDKVCSHCPQHLLLTEEMNRIVDKMASNPTNNIGIDGLAKINRLKFMYYTEAIRTKDGEIDCKRYNDYTLDLKPTKFDGQFKLIAEDALRFSSVTDIQYVNPDLEEMVYYYRGEGADKNIVIQAVLTKEGGKFRYFRYTPSEQELNPQNLPDLDGGELTNKVQINNSFPEIKTNTTAISGIADKAQPDILDVNFKAELETRNKYIPKDVLFVDVKVDHEVFAGVRVKGTSATSLKGNVANMALKSADGADLVVVDLKTKLDGKTDHRVTIPYSVRVMEQSDVVVNGMVQSETNVQIMTMSIADKAMEYIRTEYRFNSNNKKDSYLFAKDFKLDTDESLSLQYGKDEDEVKYASLKHSKTIKKNTTLVLDVRITDDHKHSLFYQINSKFD